MGIISAFNFERSQLFNDLSMFTQSVKEVRNKKKGLQYVCNLKTTYFELFHSYKKN